MTAISSGWMRALGLGAVSYLALAAGDTGVAQAQSNLPSVNVDAPRQQAAKRAPVRRTATRVRTAPRQVAAPAPAAPAGTDLGRGRGERANGPVQGYAATRSATGTKTDTPLLTTPQSISVVTADEVRDRGAQNVSEALQYVPGVSLQAYGPNAFFDGFKIRGFEAPRYLDGLRLPADNTTFALPRIETYGLERLEVLKGPSSGLYGSSEPGGLVNMVSKRPRETPHYEVQGSIGNFDRFQGAFDIGGPVGGSGELFYRLVGLGRKSDTQLDFTQDNKLFIAPSLTWKPTANTSFTILSHYQLIDNKGYQQYVPGQFTFLSGNNPNGRLPYSRYIGEPSRDGFRLEQAAIGYAFEHDFNNFLKFRQNLRYTDVTNNLASVRSEGALTNRLAARSYNYINANSQNLALDNQFQADFATGFLTHKLLVGVDYLNQRGFTDYRSAGAQPFGPFPPIDAYAPVYGAAVIPTFASLAPFILRTDKLEQTGVYAQDQIKFDKWTLTGTVRQDFVSTNTDITGLYPAPGVYQRNDSATTGRVGLNYLFDIGLSPYVSYSTSFTPNIGTTATGQIFRPTTGDGIEGGIKFNPVGTNIFLTAAAYEIRQKDVLTGDPNNFLFNVQTDGVRSRGIELEARGNITRELEVIAGYSMTDAIVTRSVAPVNIGKFLQAVPVDQASLWAKYTWFDGPLAGLGLGAGVRHVGESYGDALNTFTIPSYTLVDAAISYDFRYLRPDLRGWSAQVNATNLGNTYYTQNCLTGLAYCALGTARTVIGTLKYSWNEPPAAVRQAYLK